MSGLGDRLRRAAAGVAEALGPRRPGVELVRLEPPELPPPVPRRRPRALPAPTYPACPGCGQRHAPLPHLAAGGLRAYGQAITREPGDSRPQPLGRGTVDDLAVIRDQASAWRTGGPGLPPADPTLAELREELHAPRVPWWEQ